MHSAWDNILLKNDTWHPGQDYEMCNRGATYTQPNYYH